MKNHNTEQDPPAQKDRKASANSLLISGSSSTTFIFAYIFGILIIHFHQKLDINYKEKIYSKLKKKNYPLLISSTTSPTSIFHHISLNSSTKEQTSYLPQTKSISPLSNTPFPQKSIQLSATLSSPPHQNLH